ncbi:MAG: prenyltransferase/squalene oxidase repeat-containing protein [Planctomycetota bacterium]
MILTLTSIALFCVAADVNSVDTPRPAQFVQSMQTPAGGFISDLPTVAPESKPTLRTSRTAIRALRLLGSEPSNIDQLIRFLQQCRDRESGGFSERPGLVPDPISTSVALMVLQQLNMLDDKTVAAGLAFMNEHTKGFEQIRMVASSLEELGREVPHQRDWLSQIDAMRNADGSFGSGAGRARSTALAVVAEMRLGHQVDRDQVLATLRAGQRDDGGFGNDTAGGSDLESCYRVVRLFRRLDAQPDHIDKLHALIARCKNSDGGYGRKPGDSSSVHGTYYAAIIRYWLDGGGAEMVAKAFHFDDIEVGELPKPWQITRALSDAPGSHWKVIAEDRNTKNHFVRQASSAGPKRQYNLCVFDHKYDNLTISVDVRADAGVIDQGGGLVWRYQDEKNYYIARWNPLENNFRVYKVVDGIRSQLDTAQAVGDPAQWHQIRVVTFGRDIRCYFDNRLLLEAEDDQFFGSGKIGLWTKADAVTDFDHLQVKRAVADHIEQMQ